MSKIIKESTPDVMGKTIALEGEGGVDKKILAIILSIQDRELKKQQKYDKEHTCPRCHLVMTTESKECDCEDYTPRKCTKVKKILREITAPPRRTVNTVLNNW